MENKGVYGIYIEGKLVYVGMTTRSFKERWDEHWNCVRDKSIKNSQQEYLYEAMRIAIKADEKVDIRVLIPTGSMPKKEVELMECALITALNPRFNYVGVRTPYPGIPIHRELIHSNKCEIKSEYEYYKSRLETMEYQLSIVESTKDRSEKDRFMYDEIKKSRDFYLSKLEQYAWLNE